MNLSDCEEITNNKKIPVKSKICQFILLNPKQLDVCKISMDDCSCLKKIKRCDYIFEIKSILLAIYVELKGTNLEKACEQLASTMKCFSKRHIKFDSSCYLICSRVPKQTPQKLNIEKKFFREHGVRLRVKCRSYEYTVDNGY